ncbi:MAG: hypothetical protein ACRD1E_05215, partial [Terriglobales bacterium]
IEVRVEVRPEAPPSAWPGLEAALMRRFAEIFPYYEKNRQMGMYDLRLRLLARGSLRGPAAAGAIRRKLRRVVDERIAKAALPPQLAAV